MGSKAKVKQIAEGVHVIEILRQARHVLSWNVESIKTLEPYVLHCLLSEGLGIGSKALIPLNDDDRRRLGLSQDYVNGFQEQLIRESKLPNIVWDARLRTKPII